MKIPDTGETHDAVLADLEKFRQHDLNVRGGHVFCYSYHPGADVERTSESAFVNFLTESALDPTTFPSVMRIERDVVRMIANLLRGDENVVGNFTSGGTESILLAVKTARDHARAHRPEVKEPEILLPRSAHGAFFKAAAYFNLKPVIVEIDPETFRAIPKAMAEAITPNTIIMVGSAPQYAHGVIDPIAELAQVAEAHKLWLHVDGCVGGIQLSLMREMDEFQIPDFDFSVPGVTSISADMHKYGYSPKGASVVLYRNKSLRRHQIFSTTDSATYALINPTIQSTKSGGPMAGAWATLRRLGKNGYRNIIREVMKCTRKMMDHVNKSGDVRVLGQPDMSMFAIVSDTINVYELADEMRERGWYLQPQFSADCSPMNLHVSVSFANVAQFDPFCKAFDDAVAQLKSRPPITVEDVRNQVAQVLGESESLEAAMEKLGQVAGLANGQLPERMAFINTVLECLPRDLRATILGDFLNDLYV